MGCACGGKKKQFEHVAKDGKVTVVNSQHEAIRMVAKLGGSWRIKSK